MTIRGKVIGLTAGKTCAKEMSLASRNKIVPQMADYDLLKEASLPYVMRFHSPNSQFPSVSTNSFGFRTSIGRSGEVLDHQSLCREEGNPLGVMLGSSAVFGVGATGDDKTMPSLLNESCEINWLNFGGRAYNSTQEVLLMMLHVAVKPKKIIVYSGVNNLVLSFLANETSHIYNPFFGQNAFKERMGFEYSNAIGVRKAWAILCNELKRHISLGRTPFSPEKKDEGLDYENVIMCFKRDMFNLTTLANGYGSELYFVLQPLATWMDKKLSKEETTIFSILDSMSQDWSFLAGKIGLCKERYFDDVEKICSSLDIPYLNLNRSEFESEEWLFVDRVHLTDAGYNLSVSLIKENFGL